MSLLTEEDGGRLSVQNPDMLHRLSLMLLSMWHLCSPVQGWPDICMSQLVTQRDFVEPKVSVK